MDSFISSSFSSLWAFKGRYLCTWCNIFITRSSLAARLDKWELAIVNLDFTNLFIGQTELFTLYWDNLFVNLLVNVGFFMATISLYFVYDKLKHFKYTVIVVVLSTVITEFHLVASGLFWGLIIPSILIRNKPIN